MFDVDLPVANLSCEGIYNKGLRGPERLTVSVEPETNKKGIMKHPETQPEYEPDVVIIATKDAPSQLHESGEFKYFGFPELPMG